MEYGSCRVSTKHQNIERQVRNIKAVYPDAVIIREYYTGTKLKGRKEFEKVIKNIQEGDKLIFDSVSRMSRNAEEGFNLYKDLFNRGVEIVFLKEPHINTSVYRAALKNVVKLTGTDVDVILEGVNKYLMNLAERQIKLAFEQAEKEVTDLRQRTREGMKTAKLAGKQIGQKPGIKLETKKSIEGKADIIKYSKYFNGTLKDVEVMKLVGLARNTYYKYKRELKAQI